MQAAFDLSWISHCAGYQHRPVADWWLGLLYSFMLRKVKKETSPLRIYLSTPKQLRINHKLLLHVGQLNVYWKDNYRSLSLMHLISATSKLIGYGENMLICQRTPATDKYTCLWKACAKPWRPWDGTCHDGIGIGPASWKWDDLNMKLRCDDCSQWHKANKPSPGHARLGGGLVKSLVCKKRVSYPERLWCLEQPVEHSTGIHTGKTSLCAGLDPELPDQRNSWSEVGKYFLKEMGDWLWIVFA